MSSLLKGTAQNKMETAGQETEENPSDDLSSSKYSYECGEQSSGTSGSQDESTSDTQRTSSVGWEDDAQNIKNALAKQETKQVFRLRVLVILILVAAATSISITIYHITRSAQLQEFQHQYEANAQKIVNALQEVMIQMSAVSGLALAATADSQESQNISIVASVAGTNITGWPYVTLSNFQERAGNAQVLAGAIYVAICPLVSETQLPQWERYVQSDANFWV